MAKVELIRTSEVLTAGITNIPLTKPAKLYFISDMINNDLDIIYHVFENYNIPFQRTDNVYTGKSFFISRNEIDSKTIKSIFRNWRTLKPKLVSNWRYLFWEIDDTEQLEEVLAIYKYLHLPVYVHRSMRGYHFLSVKPVDKQVFQFATKQLYYTNTTYPPITLRIKPNKYVNEDKIFFEGMIFSEIFHTDTEQLKKWIMKQDFVSIGQQYQLVWYSLEEKKKEIAQ